MTAEDGRVRLAGAEDLGAVGRMLHDFNREYDMPTPEPADLAVRVGELVGSGDSVVLLACDQPGTAAGPDGLALLRFRRALWSPGLECYLAELYIAPAKRGRGLGRALMLTALEVARERGADTMDLGTDETDVAARGLYQSLGFTNREGGADGPVMFVYEREL